ncbi:MULTISPECIES: YncE family protein [unclassified Bacillus (in: firmicutes)]|uniref:YncE family protein n=1 Tax=unclassified Bacillus (in: firmicutes) TaxID=185979 RepID=UPI001596D235|nr:MULTISPECIES: YncE family protein [unclassified Bacillus (in: firmicutes)]
MSDLIENHESYICKRLKRLSKGTILRVLLKTRDIILILDSVKKECVKGITTNNRPVYINCEEIVGFSILSEIQICGTIPPTLPGCKTYAYVANNGDNNVSVIDASTNTVTATVPVGAGPFGTAVTPDGTRAYVVDRIGNNVIVIDTATNTVVAGVYVGYLPYQVAISPDGTRAYVTNAGSDTVSVINTACGSLA